MYLMPPSVFSTLTSPIILLAWLLTLLSNSRFAGIISLRVVLRSGSGAEEYVRTDSGADDTHLSYQSKRLKVSVSMMLLNGSNTCRRQATLRTALVVEIMVPLRARGISRV